MSGTIQMFFIVLCASFVFTSLLAKVPLLRVPSAVGYLVFGVILQTSAVHLAEEDIRWITELGDIGLYFLMFLSGLEVDVSKLRPESWRNSDINPMYLAVSMFLGTLLVSFGMAVVLVNISHQHANPWMVTLLFATTSLGIILPVLEEAEVLHTAYGQVLLLSALLADLLTMLLISLFISSATSGQLRDFLLALAVLPLGLFSYVLVRWMKSSAYLRSFAGDIQHRMRAIVALVAFFCAIANFTGSEPIIGSFLVGLLVSSIPFAFKDTLRNYAHGIGYGFLIPVFFISVGLNFDYRVLSSPTSWMWVPMLLFVAFAVKLIPAWQLRKAFGKKAALAGGVLLSSRLSLIVAAADIGVRIGALPMFLSEAIVMVAVLTCLIAPIAFVYLL